jgi:hypothetical protein
MVKPINIPWTTIQGKWDLSGVATDCSLLGWHSMLLGNLFLIIVPPSSRVKMTVLQSLEMQGTTFNTVSHPRRPESSTPWKVLNFILSNLWTGCPKNMSVLSCCLVCSITHCHGNTQANANPRLQQKPTVCYMVQTTALQNPQMGVFSVWYKLEQFEVLKVVLLKIQLFGMLNHCSARRCWWSKDLQCFHRQGEAVH